MNLTSFVGAASAGFGLLLAPCSPLRAQAPVTLAHGERVRITYACAGSPEAAEAVCRAVGTIAGERADSVVLVTPDAPLVVPRVALQGVEASLGRHGHGLAGAAIGFLLGAAFGEFLTHEVISDCRQHIADVLDETSCSVLPVLIGVPPALIGFGVGLAVRSERWQTVPLEGIRFGPAVTPERIDIALVVRR